MAVYTKRNADWLQWIAPERFQDAELFRIVTFFVFHCPCPGLSSMGKSLEEYGWHTPWKKPCYLNRGNVSIKETYGHKNHEAFLHGHSPISQSIRLY